MVLNCGRSIKVGDHNRNLKSSIQLSFTTNDFSNNITNDKKFQSKI
jgi:hypothetical protein